MWESIFFWIFAIGALLSSLAVVLIPRNPLYNALALILDFFFFAALYALLSAHFLAVVQVLVYGGAIMVLFMFIIMLLNIRETEKTPIKINVHQVVGVIAAFALLGILVGAFQGLADEEKVKLSRDKFVAMQEKHYDENLPLDTPSAIPGLALDLNENAINQIYEKNLHAYASNERRPAQGPIAIGDASGQFQLPKYREFDATEPVKVPEDLLGSQDSLYADRKPSEFGTIEPFSVLLVNRFVVPFELTAILLLAAVIGAFIIAKKRL